MGNIDNVKLSSFAGPQGSNSSSFKPPIQSTVKLQSGVGNVNYAPTRGNAVQNNVQYINYN